MTDHPYDRDDAMGLLDPNPHLEDYLIQRLPRMIEAAGWQKTYSRTPKPSNPIMDIFTPPQPRIYRYKFQTSLGTVKCEMEPQGGYVEIVMNGPGGSHEKRLNVRRYVKFEPRTKRRHLKNMGDLTAEVHLLMLYHGPIANPQLLPNQVQKLLQYLRSKAPIMQPMLRDQILFQLNQYLMGQLRLAPMNPQLQQLLEQLQLLIQQIQSGQALSPYSGGGMGANTGMSRGAPALGPSHSPYAAPGLGQSQAPSALPGLNQHQQPYQQVQQSPQQQQFQPQQQQQPQPPSPPASSGGAAQAAGSVASTSEPEPEPQETEPEPAPEPEFELPEECPACATPIEPPLLDDPPRCPACGRLL